MPSATRSRRKPQTAGDTATILTEDSQSTETETTMPATETATETAAETATEASRPKRKYVRGAEMTGDDLLTLVSSAGGAIGEDVMKQAGYFTEIRDAETDELINVRINDNGFYVAYMAAQGLQIEKPKSGQIGRPKREYLKVAKTTKKIVVGGHYAETAGWDEGDKVHVEAKPGQIIITAYQGE